MSLVATKPSEPTVDFAPLGFHSNEPMERRRSIDFVQFSLSIWKPMLVGLGGGLLLGMLAYLVLGPTYQAETRILVSEKTALPVDARGLNTTGDRGEHVTLIKSDAIVHRALEDHGLNKLPAFAGSFDPIQDIIDGLQVSRTAGRETSKDNVFNIAFTHPEAKTAKSVVESIVNAYRDYLDDRKSRDVKKLAETLITQEATLSQEIAKLEQEHFQWRQSVPPIFRSAAVVGQTGGPVAMPNRNEQYLDEVTKRLQENRVAYDDVQAKLTTLESMLANGEPRDVVEFWIMHTLSSGSGNGSGNSGGGGGASLLAGPPGKAALDSQLLTARMLEARLLNVLGRNHGDVIKVQRQIETILGFYRQQGISPPRMEKLPDEAGEKGLAVASGVDLPSIYRRTLENNLNYLQTQYEGLVQQRDEAEQKAKDAGLLELEDQRRKDAIAAKKQERADIVNQIITFRQSKDQEGFTVEPIAQIRVQKSMKQALKIIGACGILGIGTVFALMYLREWLDTSIRTQEELRQTIGMPVLGSVPRFEGLQQIDPNVVSRTGIDPAVFYYHRPGSREAEAYRTIRTTLFLSDRGQSHRIVQLSSPEPGDGKSTSSVNLAVAIAQSGKKVLLIDADLRRPTVHQLLGLRSSVGLSDVLRGEIAWDNALASTRIDGLSVMPAGPAPENPAELLSVGQLGELLREARTDYDYILVDSPPVLAVSDPCIISPHTDGMILVVRMEKNRSAALARTRDILSTNGVPVIGAIANDVSPVDAETMSEYHNYHVARTNGAAPGTRSVPPQPVG